jgi:tRNA(Arg) A34 adenosine deaminase TadA
MGRLIMDPSVWMRRAIAMAAEAARGDAGGPFAALIVRNGEVVAADVNRVLADRDPTSHAEINAIRQACRRLGTHVLSGCEIVSSCEPCPMCLGAIHWARLDRIYFGATRADAARIGFDDAAFYDQLALPPERRSIPMLPLLRDEAAAPFAAWAARTDRILY